VSAAAALPDPRQRLAWLLAAWRRAAADGRFADTATFTDALRAAGVDCNRPRVSGWESGDAAAPAEVVAGYEQVLGLTPYRLRGATDLVASADAAVHGLRLTDPDSADRLDAVLATALGGQPTGLQWLELGQRMYAAPALHLRGADWSLLTSRLLVERAEALGVEYAARTVALAQVLRIPAARPHVGRSIGSQVLTGPTHRRADAVRLLQLLPGPQTSGLTLRLLDSLDSEVRTGAAHALAAMLADGIFEPALLRVAQHRLIAGLRQDPADLDLVDAALRLPHDLRAGVAERTRNAALTRLATSYETVPGGVATATAKRIARAIQVHAVEIGLPRRERADVVLVTLCREALFHCHHRRRTAAQAMLLASPYGEVLPLAASRALGADAAGEAPTTLVPPWADVSRSAS
jgi:hypothetical protein